MLPQSRNRKSASKLLANFSRGKTLASNLLANFCCLTFEGMFSLREAEASHHDPGTNASPMQLGFASFSHLVGAALSLKYAATKNSEQGNNANDSGKACCYNNYYF